jgi:TRAP-type mannitol/chloroaromatic compound transport system permease small subunit
MDNNKLLKLMRFWLFGTFVIVFAAITAYIVMFTGGDWSRAIGVGLPIWGITAVLCVLFYFIYQWYLSHKKK